MRRSALARTERAISVRIRPGETAFTRISGASSPASCCVRCNGAALLTLPGQRTARPEFRSPATASVTPSVSRAETTPSPRPRPVPRRRRGRHPVKPPSPGPFWLRGSAPPARKSSAYAPSKPARRWIVGRNWVGFTGDLQAPSSRGPLIWLPWGERTPPRDPRNSLGRPGTSLQPGCGPARVTAPPRPELPCPSYATQRSAR